MYSIEKLMRIDSSQICYREARELKTGLKDFTGIILDDRLNAYICSDREVQVYDHDWKPVDRFVTDSGITCIGLDGKRDILLGMSNHIEVLSPEGRKLADWKAYNNDSYLTSIVAIGQEVYAGDAMNKLILHYNMKGELLNTIGKKDKEKGTEGFILPSMYFDVAAGTDGEIWAVNTGRHLVQQFNPDGDLVASWGTASMQLDGFAGCCNPVQMAILPNGNFVTYEKGLDRMKIYDPTGHYVCAVTGPANIDEKSLNTCTIAAPVHDIAVDRDGLIYALDAQAMLVRVYEKK